MKLTTKRIILAVAILSVPSTMYGLVDTYFQISQYGSIGGSNSMAGGYQSLAVGYNNVFGSGSGSAAGSYSAAVGYSLQVYGNGSLVVGSWNTPNASAAFIVGNGTSTLRKNALEVLTNGTVNIPGTANIGTVPDRGGISMGIYTVP